MIDQLPGYGPPTPVPIFQWEAEFESVLELYRRFTPERVLEIGTYHGGTLYHWLNSAKPNWDDAESPVWPTIVTVDSYAVGVDNRHLYSDWIPTFSDGSRKGFRLEVLEGDSRDPVIIEQVREHGPFDWIFIDAGHYDHEVRADWNNYRPMANFSDGATVLFHDILPPTQAHPEIEVAYLWEEIKQRYRTLEVVQDRNAEWGGIGIVML